MKTTLHEDRSTERRQTAWFAMGCFWSPEALYGARPGVLSTRTGYAGGTLDNPTYRQMGDHSETVEVTFDPGLITYLELVEQFWNHHNPDSINDYKGRQYRSMLLYNGEAQREVIAKVLEERSRTGGGKPATEIVPYTSFYPAEERHQKYYLKRFPDALEKLETLYASHEDMLSSTLAARLNGLAKGFTNREIILQEVRQWDIADDERDHIMSLIRSMRW
ncbi:peptide-methionine (S)-S-oxide reductase MsrA [Paenibacillus lemnae]|uniref:Peptide methionine sulfoxide reductase MsrA n=1 Tax=Paenibacillus lemnae TaxID=1330551 RepID=A0A848M3T7_PAELE|nr:peptide-methionine (S)-S-oxide reductase MsrA [Paenibacillus lemnae]NMO94344.1 peptide-methionine (S)-S-oxide reductase MsrA [Paenibacillus lemnae]